MNKTESPYKPSPLLFKIQSDLSAEKSKNYKLSQEIFQLKLELASTKNSLKTLEADLALYKTNEKKLLAQIQKLETQIQTFSTTSPQLNKNSIFSHSSNYTKKTFDKIESPQTKIYFTPVIGKSNDPNDDNIDLSQGSSDDSLNEIMTKEKGENLFKKGKKPIIGNKIFEDFLIIGVNEREIIERFEKKKTVETSENFYPQILYSFKNNLKSDHLTTILNCAFPFGIDCKKLRITDSFSSLNEILFASNTLFEQRDRSFVFVLKCDEDIEKEINFQYKISLSSKKSLRKVSLLQTSNPNLLKYCICFVANDYQHLKLKKSSLILKEEKKKKQKKEKESTESSSSNGKEEEESVFYSTKKVYCFVSYYPFIKFFTDVIISILNYLKLNKMKFSHEKNEDAALENYKKLDSTFLHHRMNNELELILKNIYENQIPCYSSTLIFPNFDDLKGMIEFPIPNESQCFFLEAEWLSSCVFSNLKCEQFVTLFLALMLEKTLVFFSQNLALLTSTLMTFICLLKPFKWPYPMIFNIPESLLEFLDSPVPILIGINKGKEYIVEKKMAELHTECIFVNLDAVEIFNDYNLAEEVFSQFYHQMAYKLNEPFDYFKSKKNPTGKKLIAMNPNKEDKSVCLKIFEIVKESLKKDIIDFVEGNKVKLGKAKSVFSILETFKIDEIKDGFIRRFIETQMFNYFISCK